MKTVTVLLFEDFTALDAFGPAEVLARLKDRYRIDYVSMRGGPVSGSAGTRVDTKPASQVESFEIFLLPGGFGTRPLADDAGFIGLVKDFTERSGTVLTVCTGSALLARTGLLDGRRATSNKMSWDWATAQGPRTDWVRKARWTRDGKFYTSSGVTAGIDMALGFVADGFGVEIARKIARALEYVWNEDREADPFAG